VGAHGDHGHDHGDHDHDDHDHDDHGVVEVTADNYEATITQSPYVWLVELSSKYCQSCKEFAPKWDELTRKHTSLHFAHVSIDTPAGKTLAKQLGALREVSRRLPLRSVVCARDADRSRPPRPRAASPLRPSRRREFPT
jgi:hypothetical protein